MPRRSGYSVKKLRSGRYQLVLRDPITKKQFGMGSYPTKSAADKAGLEHISQQNKGLWVDPRKGEIPLQEFLESWLKNQASTGRHSLRTQELYRGLSNHIYPFLGDVLLTDLRPSVVVAWYDRLVEARQPNPGLVPAKAYRLLHAALNEAVATELLVRNPAMKKEAGVERSKERPLIDPEQIRMIADAITPCWKPLIFMAAYCALRFGECQALLWSDVDLDKRTLRVRKAKTEAGVRTVSIPAPLCEILEAHKKQSSSELVFVGPKGGPLHRSNFTGDFRRAADRLGLLEVHFHDLRHAGGTMAAQLGATEKELMNRLGHSSPNAARRYQHAAERRDQELADKLGTVFL